MSLHKSPNLQLKTFQTLEDDLRLRKIKSKGKANRQKMVADKNPANLKSWFRKLLKIMPARDNGIISPIRLQIQIFRTGSDRAKNNTF